MKIVISKDILPNLKEEVMAITEQEIQNIVDESMPDASVDEISFIPKINILFIIYNNYKKSRVIYITKENIGLQNLGNLTLDNLENFSLDSFKLKELRHEDFDSIAEGVEVLSRIVIDNNKGE